MYVLSLADLVQGDVVYKDYFIPAGSTVVLNQW
jgi:hypothetical protein